MNAVGIDVSKGKSMVAIMRPFGEIVSTPFEIKHTSSDINSLVKLIKSIEGESRIVMEHTGRYYEVLAHQLSEANLFVSAINPKLIVKAKLFCPEIAGLFCRIAGLFCHDSRANLSLKPVCFGIAIS